MSTVVILHLSHYCVSDVPDNLALEPLRPRVNWTSDDDIPDLEQLLKPDDTVGLSILHVGEHELLWTRRRTAVIGYQDGLQWFPPPYIVPIHTGSGLVCVTKWIWKGMVYHFHAIFKNWGFCLSTLPFICSQTTLSGVNKLTCYKQSYGKVNVEANKVSSQKSARNLELPTSTQANLEEESPAQVRPWDNYTSGQYLDHNLVRSRARTTTAQLFTIRNRTR